MEMIVLLLAISCLIFLSVKVKLHPFFTLLTVSFIYGLLSHLSFIQILKLVKEAMGSAVSSLGLIVLVGTVTGGLLEISGATDVIAKKIVALTGKKLSPIGLALTGLLVSIPVFCSSAFILLAPLAKKMSKEAHINYMVMIIALSMGCLIPTTFIPPTPGPLAAMDILSLNMGKVMFISLIFGLVLILVVFGCAKWLGHKYPYPTDNLKESDETNRQPKFGFGFAISPIIVPVFLIMLKTFLIGSINSHTFYYAILETLGTTEIALIIGLLLALSLCWQNKKDASVWQFDGVFGQSLQAGAQILIIICAGSGFGAVLQATDLKDVLANLLVGSSLGLLTPFLIGVIFRTAIGSITVSLMTATSIIAPIIPAMGYDGFIGTTLIFLACASGAFMVFHGNDDMFWSVTTAADLDSKLAYKVLPIASIIISLTSFILVCILAKILL
ncbi:GntP family permease [Latilactobacillus fuchuensis]|uniref:GntP family permease n=1 Tax=Latilactobacillus fuchuensis TaxID=164393 RepID=UPI0020C828B9|nr:GntP family permease [Latilactobacillus fuchuensis]MCP8857202.1 GntP family permease [Latilactobacillus fuchuensis]